MNKNKNLIVISFVMLVNALGYGTIIPLLYPYASKFGITPAGMSLLFAGFSFAQFIATPIFGRLSDKYGRRPLLLLSLLGSSISFALFASAKTAAMLFFARILDGITGGNVSVAQAIIADSTTDNERAKGFGILGAVFGFGFVVGPAIGGIFSKNNITTPFWIGAALAFIGVILGFFLLKETNTNPGEKKTINTKLLDLKSLKNALFTPLTGVILFVSFLTIVAQNAMIIGFQTFTLDILKLNTTQIGLIFTLFGLVSVVMQGFGIKFLIEKVSSERKLIKMSILISAILMIGVSLTSTYGLFVVVLIIYGASFSPITPVLTSLLSERTKAEDQGGILGINQAYTSLGQIFGPLAAGVIVSFKVNYVFLLVAAILFISLYPASKIASRPMKEFDL